MLPRKDTQNDVSSQILVFSEARREKHVRSFELREGKIFRKRY